MNADNEKSAAAKVLYRVEKISKDLEEQPIEEHATIMQILTTMFQLRAQNQKKAQKEAEDKLRAEAEREAKFGLHGEPVQHAVPGPQELPSIR